jgi:C_GCAxxG_C_C family probable redox protein
MCPICAHFRSVGAPRELKFLWEDGFAQTLFICESTQVHGSFALCSGLSVDVKWMVDEEAKMDGKQRGRLLEQAYELGAECAKKYKGCSQCVVVAVQDTLGIRDDAVFKASTGLAGGIGLSGIGPCGAISGGVLVLSQLAGRERSNMADPENVRFKSYDLAKKLVDAYLHEFGAIACRDVQIKKFGRPYYLRDDHEKRKFQDAGGNDEKCPDVVGRAAQWTVKIILDEGLVPVT